MFAGSDLLQPGADARVKLAALMGIMRTLMLSLSLSPDACAVSSNPKGGSRSFVGSADRLAAGVTTCAVLSEFTHAARRGCHHHAAECDGLLC